MRSVCPSRCYIATARPRGARTAALSRSRSCLFLSVARALPPPSPSPPPHAHLIALAVSRIKVRLRLNRFVHQVDNHNRLRRCASKPATRDENGRGAKTQPCECTLLLLRVPPFHQKNFPRAGSLLPHAVPLRWSLALLPDAGARPVSRAVWRKRAGGRALDARRPAPSPAGNWLRCSAPMGVRRVLWALHNLNVPPRRSRNSSLIALGRRSMART